MCQFWIIVDGSNIANSKRSRKGKARLENLHIIFKYLKQLQNTYTFSFEIVTDATLQYQIDNRDLLKHEYNFSKYTQCPNKIEADQFILEFHKQHPNETLIISNDNFTKYNVPNLNLHKFVIIFNEIIIKPNIEDIFRYTRIPTFKESLKAVEFAKQNMLIS